MMGISAFAMACCWVDALEVLQYTQINRSPYRMFLLARTQEHEGGIGVLNKGERKHMEPEGDLLLVKEKGEHVLVFYYTSTEPKE
uniref:Uncharacterized protein n=1 Tax=Oryza barthii TaxID=65489 RepID=A0A0D3H6F9_9ORYZ